MSLILDAAEAHFDAYLSRRSSATKFTSPLPPYRRPQYRLSRRLKVGVAKMPPALISMIR